MRLSAQISHASYDKPSFLRGLFFCLLALFLIGATNFVLPGVFSWHDEQRLAEAGFLVSLLALSIALAYRQRKHGDLFSLLPLPVLVGLTLFAALGACSAAIAQFPHWAFLEWAWLLALLLGTFFIANMRFDAEASFDRTLLAIVVLTCVIYLVNVLTIYASMLTGKSLVTRALFYGFSNLRFFGQFQTLTLPLLALPIFFSRTLLQKTGAFVLFGMWWMLSFASGTRGTWLGMSVALLVIWFVSPHAGRAWIRLQAWGLVIGVALYGLLFFVIPGLASKGSGTGGLIDRLPDIAGLSRRDVLWGRAWEAIQAHPWLGIGPMHLATQPHEVGAHPHNAVLQIAAEWGVPALLLILGILSWGLFRFAQRLHQQGAQETQISESSMLQTALFAAMLAAATQSLVDGVIVMPYTQTVLMLLAGWSLGLYYKSGRNAEAIKPNRGRTIGMLLAAIMLLGVIAYTMFPTVLHLGERERAFYVQPGGVYLPRFWRQGWID